MLNLISRRLPGGEVTSLGSWLFQKISKFGGFNISCFISALQLEFKNIQVLCQNHHIAEPSFTSAYAATLASQKRA